MDDNPGKRAVTGVGFGRRGSSLAFRDNHEDRRIQYCNRLGCSAQLHSMKGTQTGNPEKLKLSRPSFHSTSSKATVGSSSRPFSLNGHRKSKQEQRNTISLQETITVESSSRQEQIEGNFESSSSQEERVILESNPTTTGIHAVLPESEDLESAILQGFSINVTEPSGSCTETSNSNPRKPINRRTGDDNQEASSSSSVRRFTYRNATQVVKPTSQGQGANVQRYGLRNLNCTSISDVLPSGCSSSDVSHNRRTDALRKRYPDMESSSVRGKGISRSPNGGKSGSLRSGLSGPSLSLLERPLPQPASRRTRNRPTSRDGVVSVRTRRSNSGDSRMKLSEHGDDDTFSLPEPLMISPLPQTHFSIGEVTTASSSQLFPAELTPICQNFFGRSGSSSGAGRSTEDGSSRVFHDPLVDRDGYRRFNMEGIAEVLLALERIEQDEELTYEQLMVLETNLFLGGIGFHDQHRDMRLDIDNMSYEDLLALEEKMGTVSTALTEEALSNCLKRSIYSPTSSVLGITGCGDDDDVKCSICQEDYVSGDVVGKLGCDHHYHVACIHQWLRQKNWCPICKASAE